MIDEAGQVSLANALAVSRAAHNVLLVGDPAQLDQPTRAAHPDGTDVSALGHVLGGATTMPSDRGLFLESSRRMHPTICAYISEVAYDGRLSCAGDLSRQAVRVADGASLTGDDISGAGLRYVPVPHEGNRTSSIEEALVVRDVVSTLVGGSFFAADGAERTLETKDILVVAPYNAQVALVRSLLPSGVDVGTVDRFQGREAPVVIYSLASSTGEDLPRGFEFLCSLNRLNVAVSRAQALAVLVCSPALSAPRCRTPEQVRLVNALCRFFEEAVVVRPEHAARA